MAKCGSQVFHNIGFFRKVPVSANERVSEVKLARKGRKGELTVAGAWDVAGNTVEPHHLLVTFFRRPTNSSLHPPSRIASLLEEESREELSA
jgi:hypothetical protein